MYISLSLSLYLSILHPQGEHVVPRALRHARGRQAQPVELAELLVAHRRVAEAEDDGGRGGRGGRSGRVERRGDARGVPDWSRWALAARRADGLEDPAASDADLPPFPPYNTLEEQRRNRNRTEAEQRQNRGRTEAEQRQNCLGRRGAQRHRAHREPRQGHADPVQSSSRSVMLYRSMA